jgi:hypothetical protein
VRYYSARRPSPCVCIIDCHLRSGHVTPIICDMLLPSCRRNVRPWRWYSEQQEGDDATAGFPPCEAATSCCSVWLVLSLQSPYLPQRINTSLPIFGAVQQPGCRPCIWKVATRIQYSHRGYVPDKHRDCQNQGLVGYCGLKQ